MNKHFFHAYLALLCWLPLPMASKSIIAQNVFTLAISLLSLSCCIALMRQQQNKLPAAFHQAWPVYVLFGLNLLWLLIQTIPLPVGWIAMLSPARTAFTGMEDAPTTMTVSFYPWITQQRLLLSTAYLQLFMLTLLLVSSKDRLRTLLYVLVGLGLLQAAYGGIMTLSGVEKVWWYDKEAHIGVATGTLLNRNHFANYLVFCAAAAIGLLLAAKPTEKAYSRRDTIRNMMNWLLGMKGFVRLALIIMVTGLILTHSRMGNVAFFASLSISGLLWLLLTRNFSRTALILFGSLLLVDIILLGSWFGIEKVAERIENTHAERELRNILLPYVIDMARTYMITGTGAGTFEGVFPLYNQILLSVIYNEAHSDYLQFIIEQGLIGTVPLALIILWSLVKTLTALYRRQSRLLAGTGFSVLMAMVATGIHASVEYTLQRPATASLFIIFLALPWVIANLQRHSSRRD